METNLQKSKARLNNFYRQLLTYVAVMLFLVFINYMRTPDYWWIIWPAAAWGLGLAIQAINIFFPSSEEDE